MSVVCIKGHLSKSGSLCNHKFFRQFKAASKRRLNRKIVTDPLKDFKVRAPPVEIVEEGEQVEGQLAPGLLLAVVQDVCIHHTDRIVHHLRAVGRPVEEPDRGDEDIYR